MGPNKMEWSARLLHQTNIRNGSGRIHRAIIASVRDHRKVTTACGSGRLIFVSEPLRICLRPFSFWWQPGCTVTVTKSIYGPSAVSVEPGSIRAKCNQKCEG